MINMKFLCVFYFYRHFFKIKKSFKVSLCPSAVKVFQLVLRGLNVESKINTRKGIGRILIYQRLNLDTM